ncbi:hypothetical protein SB861_61945, partial [Paraburkholderia sp. SIMBA_049]
SLSRSHFLIEATAFFHDGQNSPIRPKALRKVDKVLYVSGPQTAPGRLHLAEDGFTINDNK